MWRMSSLLILAVCLLAWLSLHLGIRATPPSDILRAIWGTDQDAQALIVRNLRIPRAVLAIAVGGALGLAGLLMQTVTRNAIAEPGLLGINAGAAFAVVVVITLAPDAGIWAIMLAAAVGALAATALVMSLVIATGSGMSPITLLLAGVSIAALLNAGLQVLIILDEAVLEDLLFWLAGAFVDRPLVGLWVSVPVLVGAAALCYGTRHTLDVLTTDDASATTLGVPVVKMRLVLLCTVALLAGSAVALAGPIAFVGLVAPHLARLSGARRHAELIPVSILWGAVLCIAADILARYVLYPTEAPVSAVMALIGVPLLIALLRRRRTVAA
ncbi:MAG: iron ABC transporter permease [Pseudomonadota bacterium]